MPGIHSDLAEKNADANKRSNVRMLPLEVRLKNALGCYFWIDKDAIEGGTKWAVLCLYLNLEYCCY